MNTFDFRGRTLRTIDIDGQLWFSGADTLTILYGTADGIGRHYLRLAPDEQCTVKRVHFGMRPGKPVKVVSESGLYKLIMRSDKAEAREFQDWVTRDVLPSIRKTGGYLLNENARQTAHADTREALPLPAEFLQRRASDYP